jgi:hypothetical protein
MADSVEPNGLAADWKAVVTVELDEQPQALIARRRFRIHIGHLLSAVWKTCVAVAKADAALSLDPLALTEAGGAGFGAVVAALNTFQEPMSKAAFMVCTVLSDKPAGLTPKEIEDELRFRCTEVPPELFPRYFGIDAKFLQLALRGVAPPNCMNDVLARMEKDGLLRKEKDDRLVFIDRQLVCELT